MSDGDTVLSTRAYAKMLLHAARYPHASVCGLLLAPAGAGGGRRGSVEISDAVPLFHQSLHLAPMYEVALARAEAVATMAGQSIAGLYIGCENMRHNSADRLSELHGPELRVADKIAEYFPEALLGVIDNRRVTLQLDRPAVNFYRHHDSGWRVKDPVQVIFKSEDASATVAGLLQRGVQRELVDLDNHLDDITLDWSNRALNTLLNSLGHD